MRERVKDVQGSSKKAWNQWALNNNVGRLIEGTKEAEISPEIHVVKNEIVITKTRLSAFLRTNLENILKQLKCDELVICGYSIDNCVGQTAIDAYEYDF